MTNLGIIIANSPTSEIRAWRGTCNWTITSYDIFFVRLLVLSGGRAVSSFAATN